MMGLEGFFVALVVIVVELFWAGARARKWQRSAKRWEQVSIDFERAWTTSKVEYSKVMDLWMEEHRKRVQVSAEFSEHMKNCPRGRNRGIGRQISQRNKMDGRT